jgi:alpha-1,2-mannosyltransferase
VSAGVRTLLLGPAARSGGEAMGRHGLRAAGWRLALITGLVGMTAYLVLGLTYKSWLLFDFKGDLFNAAQAILHGHNPYRPRYLAQVAAELRRTGIANPTFAIPVYPAPILLASVPFGLIPLGLGGSVFIAFSAAGMAWGLRMLGVRDWRCIVLALLSWPSLFGLWFGTVSPLLVLGAGIAWRYREHGGRCAGAISAMVLSKVFPWPLMLWPVLMRRWRTVPLTVALMAAPALAGWAVIGFHSLLQYPGMLSNLSYIESRAGVSVYALLLSFGMGHSPALVLAVGLGGCLIVGAWRLSRRPGGTASAFGLLVMAALTASPLVWVHYEVLLFVPIALLSPGLSVLWFLPVLGGLIPVPLFQAPIQMLMWPAIQAVVVVALWRASELSPGRARQVEAAALGPA